jgi:hypothetical protein
MDNRVCFGITVNSLSKMMVNLMVSPSPIRKVSVRKIPPWDKFPHDMNACPQLDTCHIGSYFFPLVPNFRT